MGINPVTYNMDRFILLDETARFLGAKKIELRINPPSGTKLTAFVDNIKNVIYNSRENDLIEEYEACMLQYNNCSSEDEKRNELYSLLFDCRKILREYKSEFGIEPGDARFCTRYGLFMERDGVLYYGGTRLDVSGQPERLLNKFLHAYGNRLSKTEIEELDDDYNVASRRVYRLRKTLRSLTGKNLIVSDNAGANRGYRLIIE